MNTPRDNLVLHVDEDGDPVLPRRILQLWAKCLSAQRTFEAEVIFNNWLGGVHWFVPRNHPDVGAIKLDLANALEELAASKVHVNEYPGISGALAFHDTVSALLGRASELGPHRRRAEMALSDEDGDLLLTPATLRLWAVCLSVQRTFEAEVTRSGNVEAIRDYLSSDACLHAFVGLAPRHRQSVMRTYSKAEILCEVNARHPLATPKRIDAKRAEKISWADPTMKARLAAAYAVAGDDHEKAARLLNVSIGSARLAKRRHLSIS